MSHSLLKLKFMCVIALSLVLLVEVETGVVMLMSLMAVISVQLVLVTDHAGGGLSSHLGGSSDPCGCRCRYRVHACRLWFSFLGGKGAWLSLVFKGPVLGPRKDLDQTGPGPFRTETKKDCYLVFFGLSLGLLLTGNI